MSNTTTATFTAGQTEAVADTRLLQWAYGQVLRLEGLELPTSYQVDFSNTEYCGASVPKMGNSEGVQIPNELLSTGLNVYAFIWLIDATGGRTQYRITIPVTPRPAPELPDPSPEEDSAIAEAITALNGAVEQAEASAASAAESAAEAAGVREGIAPAFDEAANYKVGDVVLYDGAVYRFRRDHAAGAWAAGDVTAATAATGWNDVVPPALAYGTIKALSGTADEHIDLDDITTPGNYRVNNIDAARTIDNIPTTTAGRLFVMRVYSATTVWQLYISTVSAAAGGYNLWVRSLYIGAWTPWQKLIKNSMIDAAPTEGSTNPVSSGGVFEAISAMTAAEGTAW